MEVKPGLPERVRSNAGLGVDRDRIVHMFWILHFVNKLGC